MPNDPLTVPPSEIASAVACLQRGGVIAMPSDTLYALCAAAGDSAAVSRVFAVKGREAGKALTLLVSDPAMAETIGCFDARSRRLATTFWPGQLTLVVAVQAGYESEALAGGTTVGLRMPDNDVALNVVAALGQPVTGTSANLSGGPDPVTPDEVATQLGERVDLILDGGPAPVGVASTIVDCTGPDLIVLREGAISREAIDAVLQA